MKYPISIQNLIDSFKKLPGIGEKTAERLALSILDESDEDVELFSKSLIDTKTKIVRCKECNNLSENDLCEICKNKNRNKKVDFLNRKFSCISSKYITRYNTAKINI